MDVSTDSDTSEDVLIRPATQDIHIRNVPAIITWQATDSQNRSLAQLDFVLVYKHESKQALIRFKTGLKLRRDPSKPSVFLLIKPSEILKLECIRNENDDALTEAEREQCREARDKLSSSAYTLRFNLRIPGVFVVPKQHSYTSFRAASQTVWKSWECFVEDTVQFMVHFPTNIIPKLPLLSLCQAASGSGLTSLNDEIAGLYGGEGGRIVLSSDDCEDNGVVIGAGSTEGTLNVGTVVEDAPPAYDERVNAGPSMSAISPPLCLSPQQDLQPDRKRRRKVSNLDAEHGATTTPPGKSLDASDLILQSLARLQRTVEESKTEHGTILTGMLAQMKSMERRIGQIENKQQDLSTEMETYVEPLWDELSARLQSQEDREHDYMRDIAEDVFGEKIDERVEERIPEALDSYFRNGDDGPALVSEVVGERIQEETREFLRRQCFTSHITIAENV